MNVEQTLIEHIQVEYMFEKSGVDLTSDTPLS